MYALDQSDVGLEVEAKGSQNGLPVDIKHCAGIFEQEANKFNGIVHLKEPQDDVDVVKEGAAWACKSK